MVTVGLAFISALVGWSATAALAAYAQRRPSVAGVGWLIAALGITVGLSAAVIGAMFDFGEPTFRLLQIGISLVGPLYLAWGALEYGVRAPRARFTSRLFLSALTIVPLVVLSFDRLSGQFSASFPAFSEHYDLIPRVLVNVTQVVAAVFFVAALVAVARRDSDDRATDLTVVGLFSLATVLSSVVGRFGLDAAGPVLMLGAVSALWGAAALAARPRRDPLDDDDYYYDDEFYDPAEDDDFDDRQEEPARRSRRDADPDDEFFAGAQPRQARAAHADMRGVITIYTLAEGQTRAFDQIAEAVVSEVVKREPDTLLYACHTVHSAPQQRIVYAIYRDELAQEEHGRQPHIVEFARRTANLVVATNVIGLSLSGAAASEELVHKLMPS